MKTQKKLLTWKAEYQEHLKAFGLKTKDGLLETFINAAIKEGEYLTQEFIDKWCCKRETETNNSYNARVGHVRRFLDYVNSRGCGYELPALLEFERTEPPYIPTEEELVNLFLAADEFGDTEIKQTRLTEFRHQLIAIQSPVVFRTLFSTGMRVTDARLLRRNKVDLENGTMKLYGKGYKERTIIIDDSLLTLLKQYDDLMEGLIPDREFFFCREGGKMRSKHWPNDWFKMFWDKNNDPNKKAVAYSLRHMFVVRLINQWGGKLTDERLYALSEHLGHSCPEVTIQHYYHWFPGYGEDFNAKNKSFFDFIVPSVK